MDCKKFYFEISKPELQSCSLTEYYCKCCGGFVQHDSVVFVNLLLRRIVFYTMNFESGSRL